MKNLYKQKRDQGFTIIEVMIVLAIAAVILLIVLLAVPALQRNSRNTQRNHDAASYAAAINTCLANHNNQTSAAGCGAAANIDTAGTTQLTTLTPSAAMGTTTQANYSFNHHCNAQGTAIGGAGPSGTSFVVQFQLETTGTPLNRCIDS